MLKKSTAHYLQLSSHPKAEWTVVTKIVSPKNWTQPQKGYPQRSQPQTQIQQFVVVSEVVPAILEVAHTFQNAVATTSITAYFLTNRSNSCPLEFKFRIEFGCAFGDEKYEHRFVRLNASKMNAFIPQHAMLGTPPNQASMLYYVIATITVCLSYNQPATTLQLVESLRLTS